MKVLSKERKTDYFLLCIFLTFQSALSTFSEILKNDYSGDNELVKNLLWTVFRAQKTIQNLKQPLDTEHG